MIISDLNIADLFCSLKTLRISFLLIKLKTVHKNNYLESINALL